MVENETMAAKARHRLGPASAFGAARRLFRPFALSVIAPSRHFAAEWCHGEGLDFLNEIFRGLRRPGPWRRGNLRSTDTLNTHRACSPASLHEGRGTAVAFLMPPDGSAMVRGLDFLNELF